MSLNQRLLYSVALKATLLVRSFIGRILLSHRLNAPLIVVRAPRALFDLKVSWFPHHALTRRRRSALPTTETELKLMAAAAIMGLSNMPKKGYRAPAAIGTPSAL